jgi:hypothetical protein
MILTATGVLTREHVPLMIDRPLLIFLGVILGMPAMVVAFVVLSAANLWSVPYQFASYLAVWSASDGYLFAHDQVRAFSVAYVLLSLCGLLVSIPVWRLLGFLS